MQAYRLLDEKAAYLYNRGEYFHAYHSLGAHPQEIDGVRGTGFVVFAPKASAVNVVGDFNVWCGEGFAMQPLEGGFWQLFVPGVAPGALYKYCITTQDGRVLYKADPFAFASEKRPGTASRVADISEFRWHDAKWLAARRKHSHFERPMNIYEMHLGSWRRHDATTDNPEGFWDYTELAEQLPPYLKKMGYTYVEFMPLMEHPLDDSWGYQITGYFAPTSRFGEPQGLMHLIDALHQAGIGVILDWVPGHFCRDEQGLAEFDGTPLYEAEDHAVWGTYKFNFTKSEVQSFLISNAFFWLEQYHADGIRVDGVTSMLYLNFGVDNPAKKRYNPDGSEECYPASAFIRKLNQTVSSYFPDVFMVAEESTAWPLVTYPPSAGGLGFHYKWDMGWMNDTLRYMSIDFPGRPYNHRLLTFSMMYAFNENFILPLSHDEVVHGKCSLIGRMPGDYWRQFAGLRLLYMYQLTHSGAKLNFMGSEIGQFIEWRFAEQLEWFLLDYPAHLAHQRFVAAANQIYLKERALWQQNYAWEGFVWEEADNEQQGVLIFRRQGRRARDFLLVILNFQPQTYYDYSVGVPHGGRYSEILNSDAADFGGSGKINPQEIRAVKLPKLCGEAQLMHGQPYAIKLTVPPLGGVIIKPHS